MGHKKLVTTDPKTKYPDFLSQASSKSIIATSVSDHPVIIEMNKSGSAEKLKALVSKNPIVQMIDAYAEQYAELLLSRNAHLYRANSDVQIASIKELLDEHYGDKDPWNLGVWVYFPWNGSLAHLLDEQTFMELRTIRNRDLITNDEQKILAGFSAVCFGMSVGSASALALSISGMSSHIKLVDGAVISGSNLNRILTGVTNVGVQKEVVIGRSIYEMNPFSKVQYFSKATSDNIADTIDGPWPSQIVVDEIDDLEMKIRIRLEARRRKLPVLMATELADTVMLDVERFDLEPNRPLFHNMIPDIEKLATSPPENHREWMKYAVKIIDPNNMPLSMQQSLLKIGSTIVTHPQLGSTVMMTGGMVAFGVKQIALGGDLKSGRHVISLEKEFLHDHNSRKYKKVHQKHTKVMHKAIEAM